MKKDSRLTRFFITIVIMLVSIFVISTTVISAGIIKRSESLILTQTQALVCADAEQLGLNINAHMDSIEGNVSLMFADDELVNYDSSTSELDEYDRINIETAISNRITDLGALENYSDFCVVYKDDNTVGWKSKTTQNLFADGGLYEEMCSIISNDKTQDGWAFGVKGNIDRMYYVKRCNPNAIIISSFYTRELEKIFQYPEELSGMTVRLVSDNGYIVYSSEPKEVGLPISADDREYLKSGMSVNTVTDTRLVNTTICENGWMLMCTVSRESMMNEFYKLKSFIHIFSAAIIVFAILVMVLLFNRLCKPMNGYVGDLSEQAKVDMLSGVLSRRGFKDAVEQAISTKNYAESAFVMLDIDNFKKINDNLGHDFGDEVISRMGRLLSDLTDRTKVETTIVGRLGGDEFAMFLAYETDGGTEAITSVLDEIFARFKQEYSEECEKYALSLSGGFAKGSSTPSDYSAMYKAADTALYISKNNGKNRYHMYEGETADEE